MALSKYEKEAKIDLLGGESAVSWGFARTCGAPYVGPPGLALTREEVETLPTHLDANARLFDLADPAQVVEYRQVIDRICNGMYKLLYRQHLPYHVKRTKDGETRSEPFMKVYIEWAFQYVSPDRRTINDAKI